ncbi:MAG: hypothetical protein HN352_11505 [Bacteroidetes bacterium]|jgi:hypothetical protein|nr:hypothetical protein [Bacteroidota bacterium]MBT3749351.1 hypothetical protein [Bacteroidota bacterium]MBT4398599.1 hypothetical protein [Bacteroidota bacterium]MBT4412108.1 hypothetical protein [Bacteroidota bacterium]MBT5428243.1 hypothetical protein [Bacteroidota bacterium]
MKKIANSALILLLFFQFGLSQNTELFEYNEVELENQFSDLNRLEEVILEHPGVTSKELANEGRWDSGLSVYCQSVIFPKNHVLKIVPFAVSILGTSIVRVIMENTNRYPLPISAFIYPQLIGIAAGAICLSIINKQEK